MALAPLLLPLRSLDRAPRASGQPFVRRRSTLSMGLFAAMFNDPLLPTNLRLTVEIVQYLCHHRVDHILCEKLARGGPRMSNSIATFSCSMAVFVQRQLDLRVTLNGAAPHWREKRLRWILLLLLQRRARRHVLSGKGIAGTLPEAAASSACVL
eukprot:scaffold3928_cov257-Pinguiococcus_pyrenoidosus.AAC.7